MQDHEIDAYLGDTPITSDQREALRRALDAVTARYPEQGDPDATTAAAAAAQVILGDATLKEVAVEWATARRIERDRMAALTGALIATTGSERDLATRAGVTRTTVRQALGKR